MDIETSASLGSSRIARREIVERTFDSLMHALAHLNAPLRASRSGNGLSLTQILLLRGVMTDGEACVTELAEELDLTIGAITHMLDKLETDGWISRIRKKHDRRVVYVQPTEKTRRKFAKLHTSTLDELTEAFVGWPIDDIENLRTLLTRLTSKSP